MSRAHLDPAKLYRHARVALCLLVPATVAVGVAWLWPTDVWLVPDGRKTMSVYLTLLSCSLITGLVMVICALQVQVNRAFRVGISTGQRMAERGLVVRAAGDHGGEPHLRVVETDRATT